MINSNDAPHGREIRPTSRTNRPIAIKPNKTDSLKNISDTYFKEIAPILVPTLLLILIVHEMIRPPSLLPKENSDVFKIGLGAIGAGQIAALISAIGKKIPENRFKLSDKTHKKLQISSAMASSLAALPLTTNSALLKLPATGYITPTSFGGLGVTKLLTIFSKNLSPDNKKKLLAAATSYAMAGLYFFADGQAKDKDTSGTALTSAVAGAFGVNLAKMLYDMLSKKDKRPKIQDGKEEDNIEEGSGRVTEAHQPI